MRAVAVLVAFSNMCVSPFSDQELADAEKIIKWCKTLEKRIESAKLALQQGAGISDALSTLQSLAEESKYRRLYLDKVIKAEKEHRKTALIDAAEKRVKDHIHALNQDLPPHRHIDVSAGLRMELCAAAKGLKTLSSLQNALDAVVLRHQSAVSQKTEEQAEEYQESVRLSKEESREPSALAPADSREGRVMYLYKMNRAIYPLCLPSSADINRISGLESALAQGTWADIQGCLIAHIERQNLSRHINPCLIQ